MTQPYPEPPTPKDGRQDRLDEPPKPDLDEPEGDEEAEG